MADRADRRDDVWDGLIELGVLALAIPESQGGLGAPFRTVGSVLRVAGAVCYPGPLLSTILVAQILASSVDGGDLGREVMEGQMAPAYAVGANRSLPGHDQTLALDAVGATHLVMPLGSEVIILDTWRPIANAPEMLDLTRRVDAIDLRGSNPVRTLEVKDEHISQDAMMIALCFDGLGAAATSLDLAVAHAKVREQFGRPIGSYQAVQHLCADMLVSLELASATTLHAADAFDRSGTSERHDAAIHAAVTCCDELPVVGATSIQVLGGVGMTWEHDAHLPYKRVLSMQSLLGGSTHLIDQLSD